MLDGNEQGDLTNTIWMDELTVGMARGLTKTIGEHDIVQFAAVSGDRNPVHLDETYAQQSIFAGRIAHGMLTASLISAVIGGQLPGHGSVYLGQTLRFRAPVRPGDRVEAEVSVREIDQERRRVTLDCTCRVGDRVVLDGEALVLAPSRQLD